MVKLRLCCEFGQRLKLLYDLRDPVQFVLAQDHALKVELNRLFFRVLLRHVTTIALVEGVLFFCALQFSLPLQDRLTQHREVVFLCQVVFVECAFQICEFILLLEEHWVLVRRVVLKLMGREEGARSRVDAGLVGQHGLLEELC